MLRWWWAAGRGAHQMPLLVGTEQQQGQQGQVCASPRWWHHTRRDLTKLSVDRDTVVPATAGYCADYTVDLDQAYDTP